MNIANLMYWNNEINTWYSNNSILTQFHRSKIDSFLKNNKHKIEATEKRLAHLRKQFFVHDDTGKMVMKQVEPFKKTNYIQKWFGKEQLPSSFEQPILLSGKKMEDYENERKIIYEEEVIINW